ncbi:UNVERIFIED_CONTAM: hypothetical protein GTU68_002054 [Idotea baltica]|nr:hypothetical protein [Idotea baltica]
MTTQQVKQRYGLIGNNPAYLRALEVAIRVANTDLSVLITGESGVGKEAFSKIIHDLSTRKHNDFIAVNCGAIPEGTIDSELFGHEKGAFTGATANRQGYFEFVNEGTIFLDEIGEMPISTQARLLRVLENGEFIKVGSSKVQKVDVRVVAATNKKLLKAVANGKFREDLYYRLNTVPIEVPALRERPEDIYLLFRKFSVDFAEDNRMQTIKLNDEARTFLESYHFPGNIREIKNLAQQISALSMQREIDTTALKGYLPEYGVSRNNMLPMLVGNTSGGGGDNINERDIMYKFLFDMKKDISELKQFVLRMADADMVGNEDYRNLDVFKDMQPQASDGNLQLGFPNNSPTDYNNTSIILNGGNTLNPIIANEEQQAEEIEETLSLIDMEREYIQKALAKYKGKRKDAAQELGISERTLYRKIREYNIKE